MTVRKLAMHNNFRSMYIRERARQVWHGAAGVRIGWALVLYAVSLVVCAAALVKLLPPLLRLLFKHALGTGSPAAAGAGVPLGDLFLSQSIILVSALFATWVMTRVDSLTAPREWLPWRQVFGSRFWTGVLWGVAVVSTFMALILAFGGYRRGPPQLAGSDIIAYAALWILVSVINGIGENLAILGYPLARLSQSLGFWPAAGLVSAVFTLGHAFNPGENAIGLCSIGLQVLFLCSTIKFTGSLWFACGVHAGGIFAEDFLFSAPDSGVRYAGHLWNASLTGPPWLTGGSVGPEGSVFAFASF